MKGVLQMSRQLKFRGKRVDNGEWVYGYYFQGFTGISYILVMHDHILRMTGMYEVDPSTIGQYTGLTEKFKDKNGKEIYEGDIVRTADGSVVATIKIGECYPVPVKKFCEFRGIKKHTVYCLHAYDKDGEYLIEDNKTLEIIGNIYDKEETNND